MIESLREHDYVKRDIGGDRTDASLPGDRRTLLGCIRRACLDRRASSRADLRSDGKQSHCKEECRALCNHGALLIPDIGPATRRCVAFHVACSAGLMLAAIQA